MRLRSITEEIVGLARSCVSDRVRKSNNFPLKNLDGLPQGVKKEVVLRLLRGEPVDAISREVSVPIYRLEEWRDRALAVWSSGDARSTAFAQAIGYGTSGDADIGPWSNCL